MRPQNGSAEETDEAENFREGNMPSNPYVDPSNPPHEPSNNAGQPLNPTTEPQTDDNSSGKEYEDGFEGDNREDNVEYGSDVHEEYRDFMYHLVSSC
ncbi:hypothetical protein HAX54_002898 [Datura stramonium]|uniref:Uncharacterized protein n=1 Tax=Datura stramonium TaxID=4076 RepID=A0ABS8T5L2_DATST|nr:hypothetical protein [Datura stramonium]